MRRREVNEDEVGKVLSVNVGGVREFKYDGRFAKSAIWKSPVQGQIAIRGINLDGDDQADREAHGGFDKAVYAYAIEDTLWWEKVIGGALVYGQFGENLTTEGIEVNDALVGERWQVGNMFPRRFGEAQRPGTYLRIVVKGHVGAGVLETIRDVFRIYTRDRDEVERLLGVPQMSDSWRGWADALLRKAKGPH